LIQEQLQSGFSVLVSFEGNWECELLNVEINFEFVTWTGLDFAVVSHTS
jgi:hypothetical protein